MRTWMPFSVTYSVRRPSWTSYGDDRHVRQVMGCHEGLDDREHGLGLGLIPLERRHHRRDPSWPVSKQMVICGSSRRSLENPGSRPPGGAIRITRTSVPPAGDP
jgi:hypothetical protein